MDESFTIAVSLLRKEYSFDARLITIGYTHKFIVLINGLEVNYEPDEERNYRAVLIAVDQGAVKGSDLELIKAVAEKIESIHL